MSNFEYRDAFFSVCASEVPINFTHQIKVDSDVLKDAEMSSFPDAINDKRAFTTGCDFTPQFLHVVQFNKEGNEEGDLFEAFVFVNLHEVHLNGPIHFVAYERFDMASFLPRVVEVLDSNCGEDDSPNDLEDLLPSRTTPISEHPDLELAATSKGNTHSYFSTSPVTYSIKSRFVKAHHDIEKLVEEAITDVPPVSTSSEEEKAPEKDSVPKDDLDRMLNTSFNSGVEACIKTFTTDIPSRDCIGLWLFYINCMTSRRIFSYDDETVVHFDTLQNRTIQALHKDVNESVLLLDESDGSSFKLKFFDKDAYSLSTDEINSTNDIDVEDIARYIMAVHNDEDVKHIRNSRAHAQCEFNEMCPLNALVGEDAVPRPEHNLEVPNLLEYAGNYVDKCLERLSPGYPMAATALLLGLNDNKLRFSKTEQLFRDLLCPKL